MISSRAKRNPRFAAGIVLAVMAGAVAAPLVAQQSPPPGKAVAPVLVTAPPDYRFQQAVQQQKVRDQVQQSQLEQQLRQGVSSNASRPTVGDLKVQQQLQQAQQAQLNSDQARQQSLIDQYRQTPILPRVVPKAMPPAEAKDHVN